MTYPRMDHALEKPNGLTRLALILVLLMQASAVYGTSRAVSDGVQAQELVTPSAEQQAQLIEALKKQPRHMWEKLIEQTRQRGIDPTFLVEFVEAEKTRRRNAQIAVTVAALGVVALIVFFAVRLLREGWRRKERAISWAEKQRGKLPDVGDGSRRAKRDLLRYQELEALSKLHKDGVIDDDEFEKRKRTALDEKNS